MNDDFKKWQKEHPNFMTPTVISTSTKGKTVIEVSEGRGFEDEKIYGVTVLKKTPTGYKSGNPRSKMFHSKQDAMSYRNKLKKMRRL